MNTKTNITDQYKKYRKEILDAFRKAQPVLNQVKTKLVKGVFELPTEKLENEKFTLTLVGAFQSGKSTLFSYLCGGLELSKVGAGLRTTGCCVTATALPEGEHDYAEVTWFDETEIKAAISDYTGENVEEIRLSDPTWRKKFEQELLEQPRIWEDTSRGSVATRAFKEIPLALLMLHFFNQYEDRCATRDAVRVRDIEDAVAYAYYPPRWNQRWGEIRTVGDIDREFRKEDVAFAFCKRIDYYIDSSLLRDLGCTIQDCPGMFATKRDTDLTNEILQRSDAILFTTPGEKELDASEVECIKECRANGTSGKLVFGANLHDSLQRWEKTVKGEVISRLEKLGFNKPEVFHYHAPLALRCSELLLLRYNELHRVSLEAVQEEIKASGIESNTPEDYLMGQIERWILRLDGGARKYRPENYISGKNIKWQELEQLHRVPMLIDHLKDYLLPKKMRSLLLDSGLITADAVVTRLLERIRWKCEDLVSDKQKTDKDIQEGSKMIEKFKGKVELHKQDVETGIDKNLAKFRAELPEMVKKELSRAKERVISDIAEEFICGPFEWNKMQKRHAFMDYMQRVIRETAIRVRDNQLSESFTALTDRLQKLLTEYREKICDLVHKTFNGIEIRCPRIERYGAAINIKALPFGKVNDIFERHERNIPEQVVNILCLGIPSYLEGNKRAQEIWEDIYEVFRVSTLDTVTRMISDDQDISCPAEVIDAYITTIKNDTDAICEEYMKDMETAQKDLRKTSSDKKRLLDQCKSLENQLENIRNEFDEIKNRVENVF